MISRSFSLCVLLFMMRCPPPSPLFPYTTLFRSAGISLVGVVPLALIGHSSSGDDHFAAVNSIGLHLLGVLLWRSEEHTSELQSRGHLVCRLLLEKKKSIVALHYGLFLHLNR